VLVWVVGRGGLLGSSVTAAAARSGARVFAPTHELPWHSTEALARAFATDAASFLRDAADGDGRWAVLWCAGKAVVASPAEEVAADVAAWDAFLLALESALAEVREPGSLEGHLLLASSAGGVWAGHLGGAITESTAPRAIAEYGRGHLRREALLAGVARRQPSLRSAIVRFSNLYGPGQRLDKPQGLVSQVSRAIIQRRPVHVYVPLDTVRDYLYATDAGTGFVEVLELLTQTTGKGGPPLVKLLASEEEVSVGGLLALFRQLTRRRVAVVAGVSAVGRLQPSRLRFRSEVWARAGRARRTPLREGVFRVYRHQLDLFTRGQLPA